MYFWQVARAELIKQSKNYFHSKTIYISLFLWPLLSFLSAYYAYKPFPLEQTAGQIDYLRPDNLLVFVLIGYLGMMFFRTLVQSAWMFSFERIYGTLELIYLSPANRFAFVLGNAVASLLGSVWLFVVFALGIFLFNRTALLFSWAAAGVGIVLMLLLATLWGMLLNSLFLFSRDTNFLYTVLEEPMELFSGVKIPTAVFPLWAKGISLIFPLTYAVEALRRIFLRGDGLSQLQGFFTSSIVIGVILLSLTLLCLKLGERHAKKTGNMALF